MEYKRQNMEYGIWNPTYWVHFSPNSKFYIPNSTRRGFTRQNFSKKNLGGFTALELLIVVSIMGILVAIILSPFASFRNSKMLDTATEETLTLLSEARGDTLSAKAGYQYGVHFETSQVVLYRGATYSSIDVSNKVVVLDSALEVASVSLSGGGSDVLFDKLTGKTVQSGSVIIRVKNDTTKTRTITIVGTGIASAS